MHTNNQENQNTPNQNFIIDQNNLNQDNQDQDNSEVIINQDLNKKAPKRLRNFLITTFSLVLVAVLGVGGYWLYFSLSSPTFTLFKESGLVFYKRPFDFNFQELTASSILLPSLTSVRTQNGYGHIKLQNDGVVSLSQNAEIFIDTDKTSTQIRLRFGNIWSRLQPLAKNETFEVETATSLATVRGTIFDVGYYPNEIVTTTAVVENRVGIKKKDANGQYINDSEMIVEENKQAFSGEGIGQEGILIKEIQDELLKSKWFIRNSEIDKEYRENNVKDVLDLTIKNDDLKLIDQRTDIIDAPLLDTITKRIRQEVVKDDAKNQSQSSVDNSQNKSGVSSSVKSGVSSSKTLSSEQDEDQQEVKDIIDLSDFSNFNADLFTAQSCKAYPNSYLDQIKSQLSLISDSVFRAQGLNKNDINNAIERIKEICNSYLDDKKKLNSSSSSSSSRTSSQSSQTSSFHQDIIEEKISEDYQTNSSLVLDKDGKYSQISSMQAESQQSSTLNQNLTNNEYTQTKQMEN